MKTKKVKYGEYCPCQVIKSEDTKCFPCKFYKEKGICLCGKYPKGHKIKT